MKYLLMLLVSGCGLVMPSKVGELKEERIVSLFAATDCVPCAEELPTIQKYLNDNPNTKEMVEVNLYVTRGPGGSTITQEDAEAYAASLHLEFNVKADINCRIYRTKYFPGNQTCAVPAAAVENKNKVILKTFPAGQLDLEQLLAAVTSDQRN